MKYKRSNYFLIVLGSIVYVFVLLLTVSATINKTSDRSLAADSNVYYVSPQGNDSYDGMSPTFIGGTSGPWKTIGKAAVNATAGKTVYIRDGVYQETVAIYNSGTANAPIKFMAYPGESPVIDGNNYQLPTNEWGVLFRIGGDYIEVSGLEVRYSNWMGVILSGNYGKISSMNSHHHKENGILVTGNYGIVEDSRIWWNAASNANGVRTREGWASGLSAARHPDGAILRRNQVFNNWGEGLSTFEATGTVMEDNIVYDNFTNVYISDSANVICQRNLVYDTNSTMTVGARVGIMLGDEKYIPPSSNIEVINNLVVNTHRAFYWWQGVQGGGMKNVLVAHNTFVNSYEDNTFQINGGPHESVRIENNIIHQEDSLPISLVIASSGLSFSNNLWSKAPSASASGSGDIIANPKLLKSGSTTAGVLTAEWFKLLSDSPAINHAKIISEVSSDYYNHPRDSQPDVGGIEAVASTSATPTVVQPTQIPPQPTITPPTPTPTLKPTATPTRISTATPTTHPTLAPSATPTALPTPTPIVSQSIHVQYINLLLQKQFFRRAYATAYVKVVDQSNKPIPSAYVSGIWSQLVPNISSATTNSSGIAVFKSKSTFTHGTFVFSIRYLKASGFAYNPSQNLVNSSSVTW